MQLTRRERIANIEQCIIDNKLGSDSVEFTEMMLTTKNYLFVDATDNHEYKQIKCHTLEDAIFDAIALIKEGKAIAEACNIASGMHSTDFYSRLTVGQMARLQSERVKFKNSKINNN